MPFLDSGRLTLKTKRAFTLIELLIVISIFGLTASLITASYITFERNQRLKNAALALKSEIRLAQNKAVSGDKGAGGTCPAASTLGGWYVKIVKGNNNYKVAGDCLALNFSESEFNSRTIDLPRGISINSIDYGISTLGETNILFRPLSYNVVIYGGPMASPDFFDNAGNLNSPVGTTDNLVIKLTAQGVGDVYQVTIRPSGEVNENRL